jgi:hypothetical protein
MSTEGRWVRNQLEYTYVIDRAHISLCDNRSVVYTKGRGVQHIQPEDLPHFDTLEELQRYLVTVWRLDQYE